MNFHQSFKLHLSHIAWKQLFKIGIDVEMLQFALRKKA